MIKVGKREFTLRTSRYLKKVEESQEELIITHQNEPRLKVSPLQRKTVKSLKGLVTSYQTKESLHKHVLPRINKWSS